MVSRNEFVLEVEAENFNCWRSNAPAAEPWPTNILSTLTIMVDELSASPAFGGVSQSFRTAASKVDKVQNIVEWQNSVEILRVPRRSTTAVERLDRRMDTLQSTYHHQEVF